MTGARKQRARMELALLYGVSCILIITGKLVVNPFVFKSSCWGNLGPQFGGEDGGLGDRF